MTPYDLLNYSSVLALLIYNLTQFRQHQNMPYGYFRARAAERREAG